MQSRPSSCNVRLSKFKYVRVPCFLGPVQCKEDHLNALQLNPDQMRKRSCRSGWTDHMESPPEHLLWRLKGLCTLQQTCPICCWNWTSEDLCLASPPVAKGLGIETFFLDPEAEIFSMPGMWASDRPRMCSFVHVCIKSTSFWALLKVWCRSWLWHCPTAFQFGWPPGWEVHHWRDNRIALSFRILVGRLASFDIQVLHQEGIHCENFPHLWEKDAPWHQHWVENPPHQGKWPCSLDP